MELGERGGCEENAPGVELVGYRMSPKRDYEWARMMGAQKVTDG